MKAVVAARKAVDEDDGFDLDAWPGVPDWKEPDYAEIEGRFEMPLGETGRALVRLLWMAKPTDPENALWHL